jgi:hypothetical protein
VQHRTPKRKSDALDGARNCITLLRHISQSWPAAALKADILAHLAEEYGTPFQDSSGASNILPPRRGSLQAQPVPPLVEQNPSSLATPLGHAMAAEEATTSPVETFGMDVTSLAGSLPSDYYGSLADQS